MSRQESDQEDWDLEILQALVQPSTADDAALACAAAWMNFLQCDRVAVVIFDSSQSCVVAHGQKDDDGRVAIYVGNEQAHVSTLLQPDLLWSAGGPCSVSDPNDVVVWPQHLSAVLAVRNEETFDDDRIETIHAISRKLLSRWSAVSTNFVDADRMEALAEFAAGAGHEINNPLGSIIGQTQLLSKRTDRPDQKQALETIGAQAWRIRDMIGDTMLFARPPQPEFQPCRLSDLVVTVAETIAEQPKYQSITIETIIPESESELSADASQLSILIQQLIENACDAVVEQPRASITVEVDAFPGSAVVLSVDDDGAEMDETVRRHLFDPFFSGRQAGRGLGFGLCHAWQIARLHNGLLMHEALENGNRFLAAFPT